jgi:hypothetical protein
VGNFIKNSCRNIKTIEKPLDVQQGSADNSYAKFYVKKAKTKDLRRPRKSNKIPTITHSKLILFFLYFSPVPS